MSQRAAALAESLTAWREAHDLLAELPGSSPDARFVALVLLETNLVSERLRVSRDESVEAIAAARATIAQARDVLDQIRAKRRSWPGE